MTISTIKSFGVLVMYFNEEGTLIKVNLLGNGPAGKKSLIIYSNNHMFTRPHGFKIIRAVAGIKKLLR